MVGNGASTKLWSDRWLHGKAIAEYAPNMIQIIPREQWSNEWRLKFCIT